MQHVECTMTRFATPTSLQDITPSWLTEVLHSQGPKIDASVTKYSVEIIGEGKGFMNQLARLSIEYNRQSDNLPHSIVAKLPTRDPVLRKVADLFECDQREVRFYQAVAPNSVIQTPHIYYSAIDEVTGDTILLMEDMSNARQGDSVAGCSLTDAKLAIDQLARFHSSWWQSPHLDRLEWMPLRDAETSIYQQMYPDAWELLVSKAGKGMTRRLQEIGGRVSQDIPRIKTQLTKPPRTINHGDYRLDNCFLSATSQAGSLVVFDWEYCSIGRGAYDVATFINEAFPPNQRRREEMALLSMYHSLLVEQGINDYLFEECLQDYRLSMLEIFIFWVVVGGYCDFETERATIYLHNACERFDASIYDLNCAEFLST
ncbi:DUF1679 domain-containing protein [SAR202 cluster bacterium AC-647-N09_OGT_505m]|nr:DUF1679 domain-containing protein [SAR202 cluster bacterium AC-647-N09_OGT_505m]